MMEVYQLHVWLCEISPLIWRRLLVRRETGCHGGPVPSRGVLVVLHERHLRHILTNYFAYYHQWRTHLSPAMDCPVPRPVLAPDRGKVVAVPEVGGLHQHYKRGAA
jgi:hypothetical protein